MFVCLSAAKLSTRALPICLLASQLPEDLTAGFLVEIASEQVQLLRHTEASHGVHQEVQLGTGQDINITINCCSGYSVSVHADVLLCVRLTFLMYIM